MRLLPDIIELKGETGQKRHQPNKAWKETDVLVVLLCTACSFPFHSQHVFFLLLLWPNRLLSTRTRVLAR
ncbi:hypothetical protein QN277_026654 [Acacia crassicarpa]|uniref:Uncharacterized protein n=1 Tax=Acacia crassicarpa TaxID=499986 RepID=A0AAE1ML00_9FABA|nr:hypothetical protein QN277_026654 [Acacia crassicarpa]